jgi:HNH endonuclease
MSRTKISNALKKQVSDRARGCCEYCKSQRKFSPSSFEIEHIVPISRGGSNTLENLALACAQCNSHKSNKVKAIDPASGKVVQLFHPRQMDWAEHFTWSNDTLEMLAITSIGRATVALLQTNREAVINLRQILRQLRLHPPD